jgi:hypothetical protein
MNIMGVYTLDRGHGEALEAFHASNPPLTDGPLVSVVSHPPLPPSEVILSCANIHVVSLHLTRVCKQCSH